MANREGGLPGSNPPFELKKTLIKSFDRLSTNGKWLIRFVVNLRLRSGKPC